MQKISISNEIVGFINRGVDSFSRGLAESLLLGNSIKETFSNMAKTISSRSIKSINISNSKKRC